MQKFILGVSWFLSPLIILHLFTFKYYVTDKADLLYLGYIIDLYPNYHTIFSKEYEVPIRYTEISQRPAKKNYTALTIGDSFSELEGCGYKNYLAQNKETTVLHIDRALSDNQIQTLYKLINGDFFEQYTIKFVILQNIERHYMSNIFETDPNKKMLCSELYALSKEKKNPSAHPYKFLSDRVLKFPYYTVQYYLQKTFLFNDKVYKTTLSNQLFSVDSKNLLFYHQDLMAVERNNDTLNIRRLNDVLNDLNQRLNQKGVQLIVLAAPDKYDIYYDYIVDKQQFPRPLFFEHYKQLSKNYINIDSKKILSQAVKQGKDIYYYDDTHWSPKAAQLMAKEIQRQIALHR